MTHFKFLNLALLLTLGLSAQLLGMDDADEGSPDGMNLAGDVDMEKDIPLASDESMMDDMEKDIPLASDVDMDDESMNLANDDGALGFPEEDEEGVEAL